MGADSRRVVGAEAPQAVFAGLKSEPDQSRRGTAVPHAATRPAGAPATRSAGGAAGWRASRSVGTTIDTAVELGVPTSASWCAAVAWGAGLANHWPLTVLATPGLALVLLPVWRDVRPRLPRLLGAALAAAALPYAWMVWLSHQGPIISFYGPVEGWGDLWFYVSRQGYSGVDVSPSAGWGDRPRFPRLVRRRPRAADDAAGRGARRAGPRGAGARQPRQGDDTGPLGYYRYVEEGRPDVALYNLRGLVFGNRLFDPRTAAETRQRALDRFVASTDRPVFLHPEFDIAPTGRGFGDRGFVLEVLGEGTAETAELRRDERGERYFIELLGRRPVDRWERWRRNNFLTHYGRYLGRVTLLDSPALRDSMTEVFEGADDCYPCLLSMAGSLLDQDAAGHAGLIAGWLARAGALRDQAMSKQESAKVFFERGRLAELTGDAAAAAIRYREAYAIFPHPERDAGAALRRLGLAR